MQKSEIFYWPSVAYFVVVVTTLADLVAAH